MAYKIKPGGLRLPCINVDDFEKLDYLTEEEKQMGIENITDAHIVTTDGWLMLGNNPEIQSFWQLMESEIIAMQEGDFQSIPFGFMNLTNLLMSRLSNNDYMKAFMAASQDASCEGFGLGQDGMIKYAMLEDPDSTVWSEEERLCIKFITACIKNEMTDEIFQAAIDSWGEKKVITNMAWISFVWGWQMLLSALNVKFDYNTRIKRGTMSQAVCDKVIAGRKPTSENFRKFWRESAPNLKKVMLDK